MGSKPTLDTLGEHPDVHRFLQRKYRLDRFRELSAPEVVINDALKLMASSEKELGEAGVSVATGLYPAYFKRRRARASE